MNETDKNKLSKQVEDEYKEAVLLADRADVTEEIVRLEGHLEQAGDLLGTKVDAPVGKRLEFLVQEILRETNTIGSFG